MLDLLKELGIFVVIVIVCAVVLLFAYSFVMRHFGYEFLFKRAQDYLRNHGRGNFVEDNEAAISRDAFLRAIAAFLFSLLIMLIGCIIVNGRIYFLAVVISTGFVGMLLAKVELGLHLKIGRLTNVDEEQKRAYFIDLKCNSFTYDYGDESMQEILFEKRKYMVASYGDFAMVGAVDEYEWR